MAVRKRSWRWKGVQHTAWIAEYTDGQGRRRQKTFDSQRNAKAWLIETQHQVSAGTHTPESTSPTVARAAELWVKSGEIKGRERSTMEQRRQHIAHIAPLAEVKLARLTAPMVEEFVDHLLAAGSRAMARKVLSSLKGIIRDAQRRGLVAQNVALAARVDADRRSNGELEDGRDFPVKEEIRTLLTKAAGHWRPFFITAVFTGMRASELRGLTWANVDFDRRVIRVRQRADLWGKIGRPKSRAGYRTIPMTPMVINALKGWKLVCPKGERELVFPNGAGNVESHQNIIVRGWGPLQRTAGVVGPDGKPKYGLHALRHFYASWIIHRGFSPKQVQTLMGHARIQITLDIYAHLFPSHEDDHAKLAEAEGELLGLITARDANIAASG